METNTSWCCVLAFILYRQHHQASVAAQHPGLANPEISKLIGEQWRGQPEDTKDSWKRLAEEEKLRHQRQYPDYRYQPRRGGKNGANGKPSPGVTGDDPGRCQKCGGRFIATPRTPITSFSAVMTPAFAKPIAAAVLSHGGPGGGVSLTPGVMMHNPNPRVIETDHLTRRGSNASTTSVDSHGRRYTQPYMRDIEEDYAIMSPTEPSHKRHCYINASTAPYVHRSPSMSYVPHPSDMRYVLQRPSISGPSAVAAGYGPTPSPRPPYEQQQQHTVYSPAHMRPPPRPSISYPQVPSMQATVRGFDSAFDESLRLPPLQTQMPGSLSVNSDTNAETSNTETQLNGLEIMSNDAQLPLSRGQSLPLSQRPQWLFRLDMLRAISPPLQFPAPGAPAFEVRGSIIALEGASRDILRQIAAVIEETLSVSSEYAVKIWPGHDEDSSNHEYAFNNSVAKFQARMLKWHHTSEELVKYITHHPTSDSQKSNSRMGVDNKSPATYISTGSSTADPGKPTDPAGSSSPPSSKFPVAVLSGGYSLTVADRDTAALHIADAYRPDDHWRWVATMWRGIVGADLTLYVKQCPEDELRTCQVVELANSSALVVRVPESKSDGGVPAVVDEKLKRRLGFEIMEWVRGGQFGRRSV